MIEIKSIAAANDIAVVLFTITMDEVGMTTWVLGLMSSW